MQLFRKILEQFSAAPEWIALIALPAAIAFFALIFTLFGGRKAYPCLAIVCTAMGTLLVYCTGESGLTLSYFLLSAAESALLGLLFLFPAIPFGKRRARRKSKSDRMFEKFRTELSEHPFDEPVREDKRGLPPKVCCFEEAPQQATENGAQLEYVLSLVEKLRAQKLSAGDRLELDVLSRSLDGCRAQTLTPAQAQTLNDCLATVLKLTAKYRL